MPAANIIVLAHVMLIIYALIKKIFVKNITQGKVFEEIFELFNHQLQRRECPLWIEIELHRIEIEHSYDP